MSKWWKRILAGTVIGVFAVAVAGCGDDDKGNNDGTLLTEEEQYEQMSRYFNFSPTDDGDPNTVEIAPYMLSLLSNQYWDGIGLEDAGGLGKRVAAFPMASGIDEDSVSAVYYPLTGWWVVYASIDTEAGGEIFHFLLRDSVRFEDAAGGHQPNFDDETDRIVLRQSVAMAVEGALTGEDIEEGEIALEIVGRGNHDISGFSADDVVDANADVGVSLELHTTQTSTEDVVSSADLVMTLDGEFVEVMVPVSTEGDACPTSGQVSSAIAIDIDVQVGDEHGSAEGSWDATMTFTGNGNADVTVESGNFSRDYSGQVCDPVE